MEDIMNCSDGKKRTQTFGKAVNAALARYRKGNEDTLIREIFVRAATGKKKGVLTDEELNETSMQVLPLLDAEKQEKYQKLMEKLKTT